MTGLSRTTAMLLLLGLSGELQLLGCLANVDNAYTDPDYGNDYQLCGEEILQVFSCTNRICLEITNSDIVTVTNNPTLQCGPCKIGYIEFGDYANYNKMCVEIDRLTWSDYKDAYNPVYNNEDERAEENSDQRLQFLKDTAGFIMTHSRRNRFDEETSTGTDTDIDADTDIDSNIEALIQDDNTTVDLRWSHMSYNLGLTPFSADYTAEDYRSRAGYIYRNVTGTEDDLEPFNATEYYEKNGNSSSSSRALQFLTGSESSMDLPSRVDWVELGGVTHVKDQGRCGCCWAISLSGAIEGAVYSDPINNGYLQSMSFQQFISCSKVNDGCDGGNLAFASLYAQLNLFQGITRLNDYPYSDYFGRTSTECLTKPPSTVSSSSKSSDDEMPLAVEVDNAQRVAGFGASLTHQQRVQEFKEALAIKPIAMVISSSCRTLSNYRKGVLTDDGDCACTTVDCIDHAILMVGYDDTADIPYFKMKNSWGTMWGEDGYFRVAQTPGLGTYGLFGILAEGVVATGHNTTGMVKDEKQLSPIRQWWAILLITFASLFAFYVIFRKCWERRINKI